MKYHRYVTLALILAIPVSIPQIIIAIMNKGPVYLIIDKSAFLFWFIGMWNFFHEKRGLGLTVMVSSCCIFFVWAILFFKVVSISIFVIIRIFLIMCFTIKTCFSVWLEWKNSHKNTDVPTRKKKTKRTHLYMPNDFKGKDYPMWRCKIEDSKK